MEYWFYSNLPLSSKWVSILRPVLHNLKAKCKDYQSYIMYAADSPCCFQFIMCDILYCIEDYNTNEVDVITLQVGMTW